MSHAVRTVITSARSSAPVSRATRRFMSSDMTPQQIDSTRALWKNVSLIGTPLIGAYAFYVLSNHHGCPPRTKYSYMEISKKEFPWGADPLFGNPNLQCGDHGH
eukprot:TRINITY_DN659_c0_g1_i1.p1 TRINITY_DN659_c0_g1~~TRINITY_DN659_c0_g1_i1.p1  ORF type:complete len:119 (+),score=15.79 TRINITY_DN659_c0_g1_i1:46-357(+)